MQAISLISYLALQLSESLLGVDIALVKILRINLLLLSFLPSFRWRCQQSFQLVNLRLRIWHVLKTLVIIWRRQRMINSQIWQRVVTVIMHLMRSENVSSLVLQSKFSVFGFDIENGRVVVKNLHHRGCWWVSSIYDVVKLLLVFVLDPLHGDAINSMAPTSFPLFWRAHIHPWLFKPFLLDLWDQL